MEVTQQPQALTFVGNIPDILVTGDVSVNLQLMQGVEEIFQEEYFFDEEGQIRIPLEELIDDQLSIAVPTTDLFQQTGGAKAFKVILTEGAEEIEIDFIAVKGGVDRNVFNTSDFVKENLLTWQPQTKEVKWFDPSYLSYYATEAVTVRAKGFFPGGTDQTITLHTINTAGLWSWNVMYADLEDLFSQQPIYIDIWVESVAQTEGEPTFQTFTQRYVLTVQEFDYDDVYVFENSLGGIDTIRLTGEKKLINANRFDLGIFYDRVTMEYQVNPEKAFEKNTGYFPSKNALKWSQDFFSSKQKYIDEPDGLKRILTRDPELVDIQHQLAAFDFVYIFTEQTVYLDLNRDPSLVPVLVVIGPGDNQYFLVPREYFFPTLTDPSEAVFIVRREGETNLSELPIDALLAWLLMNLGGGLDGDLLDALNNAENPNAGNPFITSSALTDVLEGLNLDTGRRLVSSQLLITGETTGILNAVWYNGSGVLRTLSNAEVTFPALPSAGNRRWDLIELYDNGTFQVKSQNPVASEAIRPDETANTLVVGEAIWDSDGNVQQPNLPVTWSNIRYSTQLAPDTTGKFAKIWQGNLSRDNNYGIIIAYNDPKNGVNFDGTGTGLLKVSWTCDTNRNILASTVKILTDQDSMAGEFRLVQIAGNQAAIYHKGSHFWSRIDFRVLFNSHAVQLADFVDQGVYEAAPTAVATYDSQQQGVLEYFPSTGPILFDAPMGRPRSYGDDTPVTGNITFGTTGGITTVMPKVRHNDSVEPTFTPPGGVALIKEGGTYEVNVDNYILAICEKNTSGAVVRIRYTISKNEA